MIVVIAEIVSVAVIGVMMAINSVGCNVETVWC